MVEEIEKYAALSLELWTLKPVEMRSCVVDRLFWTLLSVCRAVIALMFVLIEAIVSTPFSGDVCWCFLTPGCGSVGRGRALLRQMRRRSEESRVGKECVSK